MSICTLPNDIAAGTRIEKSMLKMLLTTKFADWAADERLERILSEGKKLVSVSVDSTAASVANHLKAGDIVSLVCFIGNSAESFEELKHLEVYSIENKSAVNVEDVQEGEKADTIAAVNLALSLAARNHMVGLISSNFFLPRLTIWTPCC